MEKLLTHSCMSCAKECPRKYYYRYVCRIVREQHDTPLYVGSLFHEGMETREVPERSDYSYPDWMDDEDARYKMDTDFAKARAMIRAYFDYWSDDAIEVLETELSFVLKVINPETKRHSRNFVAAGKLDKIVRIPAGLLELYPDGCKALLEHKTTSDDLDPDSPYWRKLKIDQQISHYFDAANRIGHDLETTVYDVTRRPDIRPKAVPVLDEQGRKIVLDDNGERVWKNKEKDSPRLSADSKKGYVLKTNPETPDQFEERCYAVMIADPDRYFARRDIPRERADIEEFRFELWQQQKMLSERYKNGYWFRDTGACFKWNKPCAYFDICTGGEDVDPDDEYTPLGFEFREPHEELSDRKGGEEG